MISNEFPRGLRLFVAALFLWCASESLVFAQLSFTKFELITNREARVQMTVPAGTIANIDVSSNSVDWAGFLTAPAGALTHTDILGTNDVLRFYRASQAAAGTLTGDHIQTTEGDLVIHPVYHAGFVMSWNGKMIYSDPNGGSYSVLPKGDLLLVTHDHSDHFNATVLAAQKSANAVIVAPQSVYSAMTATLKAITCVQTNGASTNFFGIQIDTIAAYNSYHTKGACNAYVLTLGGKRIFISGDTGDTTEMRALQNLDVAFLCVNQPYTLSVAQAVSVIRALSPRVVYPYHLQNQDGTYSNVSMLKTNVGTDLGIQVRLRKWY